MFVFYNKDKGRSQDHQDKVTNTEKGQKEKEKVLVEPRFSAPFQTDPGAHPSLYTIGTEGKAAGAWR